MKTVVYTELTTPVEFERATDVEIAVWGLDPRDAIPANMFRALIHNGGILIGATIDDELVGIAFAFSAQRHGRPILWSHVAGVLPQYQGQGIGEGLKMAQRTWALAHDIDEIRWTFDPLQRGNANFNLTHLGAVADAYHENLYGMMTDVINAGMPSDRVEASWLLSNSPNKQTFTPSFSLPIALKHDEQQRPCMIDVGDATEFLVEIPNEIAKMRAENRDKVLEWRLALRKTLVDAFSRGYTAAAFLPIPNRPYQGYLLKKVT